MGSDLGPPQTGLDRGKGGLYSTVIIQALADYVGPVMLGWSITVVWS